MTNDNRSDRAGAASSTDGVRPAGADSRNATIDVLRGGAIVMVLLLHFGLTYHVWDHGPLVWLLGPDFAWSLLGWGNFGVTVFFVVSGFLISSNAIGRFGCLGNIRLRDFYVRRAARIMPGVVLALSIIVSLGLARIPSFAGNGDGVNGHLLLGALSVLGFFHNVLMQKLGYFNYCLNVYWSLSVEEVFYIGFPLVCLALRRDTGIAVPCLLLIVAAPIYRASHADNDIYYLYANPACFDAIAIGCLTAMLCRTWAPSRRIAFIMRIVASLSLTIVWVRGFGGPHKIMAFTYVAILTAAIIVSSLGRPHPKAGARSLRAIRWMGRHSYELYLFHIIILAAMRDLVPGPALSAAWQLPWLATFLALSCAVAREIANRFSEPANRLLRRRLLPRKADLSDARAA